MWSQNALSEVGLDVNFVQDNHSLSRDVGTVRGLHFQAPPRAQDKLVRCGAGAILDVVVDIRSSSSTYGNWISVQLDPDNGKQVFVPNGFLHGFSTLVPDSEILYKCSDVYAPEAEGTVHFASATLGIDWLVEPESALLSDRDRQAVAFSDFHTPF